MRTLRTQRENHVPHCRSSITNPQEQSVGGEHGRKSRKAGLMETMESCQSQKQKGAILIVDRHRVGRCSPLVGRKQRVCQGPIRAGTRWLAGPIVARPAAYLRPHLMSSGH